MREHHERAGRMETVDRLAHRLCAGRILGLRHGLHGHEFYLLAAGDRQAAAVQQVVQVHGGLGNLPLVDTGKFMDPAQQIQRTGLQARIVDGRGVNVLACLQPYVVAEARWVKVPQRVLAREAGAAWLARLSAAHPEAYTVTSSVDPVTGEKVTVLAWIEQHPDVDGRIVDRDRAEEIGRTTFGPLLRAN
ncbi:hypothetical protein [Streptomyces sp. NPDC055400]